jgi:hypothetical protein
VGRQLDAIWAHASVDALRFCQISHDLGLEKATVDQVVYGGIEFDVAGVATGYGPKTGALVNLSNPDCVYHVFKPLKEEQSPW